MNSETLVFWGYPLGKFSVSGDLPSDTVPSLCSREISITEKEKKMADNFDSYVSAMKT